MFDQPCSSYSVSAGTISEILELQQITYSFRQEVAHRAAFETYCRWYDQAAQQHQAELIAMERDIPILDWFLGARRVSRASADPSAVTSEATT
jgi:hypothetical protein